MFQDDDNNNILERKRWNKNEVDELRRLNELKFAAEAQRAIDAKILEDNRKIKERIRLENYLKNEHISRVIEANRRAEEVRRKNKEKEAEIVRKTL